MKIWLNNGENVDLKWKIFGRNSFVYFCWKFFKSCSSFNIPVLKVLFFKSIDQNSSELIARNHCIEESQFDGVAVWSKSGVVVLV
jgi:hypothetical protein